MIYLSPEQVIIVKQILKKHIPDRKVFVFGSRVKGKIKPYSDLDLCIMGAEPLSMQTLGNLKDAFSHSDLPMRVDLVEWGKMTPDFQAMISEQIEALI
jgi:predicted nucleotidyltransferase